MQISQNELSAMIATIVADGGKPCTGAARQTFDQNQSGLGQGTYTPIAETQTSRMMPRRNGNDYEVLVFTDQNGQRVSVSTGSLFNTVKVVNNFDASTFKSGSKWLGEGAQPTTDTYRYGQRVALCERDTVSLNGETSYPVYKVPAFTLSVEKVYVVPRFVEGSNRPIYDEQCALRKAWFAVDAPAAAAQ